MLVIEDSVSSSTKKITRANLFAGSAATFGDLEVTGNFSISGSNANGWDPLGIAVSSATNNGNHSYDVTFASTVAPTLTPGMRLRLSRTVAAPTQCTDLESGSSQYFSKTSPAGMTFTDDFTVSAWVKVESYPSIATIASRYNGTSGWAFYLESSGRLVLAGFNAGSANNSYVISYQSVPLNKWVHVTAQLDMSTFTATTTTSYIMFDGVDVPASVVRNGTNPTALIQAGDLQIGSRNGADLFDGKIAQVAIYSAKVTQATIRSYMSQTLSGSETSLISAYSFNNSIVDLNTTNANNLSANGSAVATNSDSPFALDANGTPGGTYEWGIVTKVSTTTATVQTPEGSAIPTSGGVSAVDYSTQKAPYGFPASRGKWAVETLLRIQTAQNPATQNTWYNLTSASGTFGGTTLSVPIGEWSLAYSVTVAVVGTNVAMVANTTLSTASNTESDRRMTAQLAIDASGEVEADGLLARQQYVSLTSATSYYLNTRSTVTSNAIYNQGAVGDTLITAECAYL